jgi:hypothetical protein
MAWRYGALEESRRSKLIFLLVQSHKYDEALKEIKIDLLVSPTNLLDYGHFHKLLRDARRAKTWTRTAPRVKRGPIWTANMETPSNNVITTHSHEKHDEYIHDLYVRAHGHFKSNRTKVDKCHLPLRPKVSNEYLRCEGSSSMLATAFGRHLRRALDSAWLTFSRQIVLTTQAQTVSATRIQSWWRAVQAINCFRKIRWVRQHQGLAVVRIQALSRRYLMKEPNSFSRRRMIASAECRLLKTKRVDNFLRNFIYFFRARKLWASKKVGNFLARTIQMQRIRQMDQLLREIQREVRWLTCVQTIIQRIGRGFLGRLKARQLRLVKLKTFRRMSVAAVQIQSRVRLRRRTVIAAGELEVHMRMQAASNIQKFRRAYLFFKTLRRCVDIGRSASIDLQSAARGFLGRQKARRERRMVEIAWQLAGLEESRRRAYANYLPRARYAVR